MDLTTRQTEVLEALCRAIDEHDKAPSLEEIGRLTCSSRQSIQGMMRILVREGCVVQRSIEGGARSYWPLVYPDGTPFPTRSDLVGLIDVLSRALGAQAGLERLRAR